MHRHAFLALFAAAVLAAPAAAEDPPLVVHEWGTFTSFSGSDGVKLEFRPLVGNDLPRFVNELTPSIARLLSKPNIRAIQRMETPVTYFYTPVERDVSVSVEFPDGLLTEFYPPVSACRPAMPPQTFPPPADPPAVPTTGGLLDWGRVHLIPTETLRPPLADEELSRRFGRELERRLAPPADGFPHYDEARATDSAIVRVRRGVGAAALDHFEKFLFYRGLGNFDLPVTAREAADGTFELTNAGGLPVRSVFHVHVDGEAVRFRRHDAAGPGETLRLDLPEEATDLAALSAAMTASLVAEGLYEKEAAAMVACWRSSWFGEPGSRVLYMVPQAATDELLPLHVSPEPTETVRVLVGRIELMSSAKEREILNLVSRSAAARPADATTPFESPSLPALASLGRMAEPALMRAKHLSDDPRLKTEADRLVVELRDQTN